MARRTPRFARSSVALQSLGTIAYRPASEVLWIPPPPKPVLGPAQTVNFARSSELPQFFIRVPTRTRVNLGSFRYLENICGQSQITPRGFAIALLSDNERKKVVEAIKHRSAHATDRRKRGEARHDASRLPDITIEVRGPTGDVQTHTVPPVDLSPSGMAFLHCSFLYPGSVISATLRTRDGEQMCVTGKVMRCEHVSGRVHEVGVKLDHAIDPAALGAKLEEPLSKPSGTPPWDDIRRIAEKLTQIAAEAKDASGAGKLVAALARYESALIQR